ncbi:Nuclear transcription factor Y subunit C-2 [Senna tora]|uniref:Nuclear transcription factor Y subunit C-2 n=1 Tax=Senna tora TaxID=362788 RepID=A0A834TGI7_9FABA|nr:Nuclear transcription factor Y subunit C-2 [Senna tora]
MENEGNTSYQHASQNVLGDFGSTENFNQQPLTDFSNIINQPASQQVPKFMSIPPYMLAQYRQEEQKNQALQMFRQQQLYEIQNAEDDQCGNSNITIKACEMFIQEMSLRDWMRTEKNKRRVIQRGHPFLVPPPQPQLQEEHSGQAAENPNYVAPIVDESLMNMGINVTDQQAESSQQYTEAFTMDPSIVPSHPQFPPN